MNKSSLLFDKDSKKIYIYNKLGSSVISAYKYLHKKILKKSTTIFLLS